MRPISTLLPLVLLVLVSSVVVSTAACPAHLMIDPPPPASAPVEVRESYYKQHRPEKPERGELLMRARLFGSTPSVSQKALHLHNGARVECVEDLLPLVLEDSETAKAINLAVEARSRADVVTAVGLAVAGLGLATGAALVSAFLLQPALNNQGNGLQPLLFGGGATMAGGAVVGAGVATWGMTIRDDEEDARMRVFRSLDAALTKKLALEANSASARGE